MLQMKSNVYFGNHKSMYITVFVFGASNNKNLCMHKGILGQMKVCQPIELTIVWSV